MNKLERLKNRSILIYANYGIFRESSTGEVFIPSIHYRYIQALRNIGYEEIGIVSKVCHAPHPRFDQALPASGVTVYDLPWFENYLGAVRHFFVIVRKFCKIRSSNYDRVFIRVFEPFTWLLVLLLWSQDRSYTKRNVVMHFVAEPRSAIFGNRGHSVFRKALRLAIFMPEYALTLAATFLCRATANGPVPAASLPSFISSRFREVIESALLESDVISASKKGALSKDMPPPFRVLFVGYLRNSKGIDTLLGAAKIIAARRPGRFVFEFVGEGEMRPAMETFVADNGLEDTIFLYGHMPYSSELFERFSSAHIFVNPSSSETGPRVLLEAKLYGCFLVSTPVGYAELVTEAGDAGLLFPIGNSNELADAIDEASQRIEQYEFNPQRDPFSFGHNMTAEGFLREVLEVDRTPNV